MTLAKYFQGFEHTGTLATYFSGFWTYWDHLEDDFPDFGTSSTVTSTDRTWAGMPEQIDLIC